MLCFGLNLPRVLPCAVATGHTAVGPLAPLGVFTSAETNCASNLLVKKSRSTWLTWSTIVKITKLHLELCIFWCSIQYTPVPTCSHLKPPKSPNNFAQVQSTGQGCSLHFFDSSAATCWACYILFQDLANLSPCLKFRKHVQKNRKRRYLYSKTADNIFKIFQPTPRNSKNYHRPHHPTILGRTSALFPAVGGSPRHAPRSFLHSTSARFGAPDDHEKWIWYLKMVDLCPKTAVLMGDK